MSMYIYIYICSRTSIHTYIRTYIYTYIHADRETDRQTYITVDIGHLKTPEPRHDHCSLALDE